MKVNIGRQVSGKKYKHNLPVSVTTTSQFGFLQPFYCRESAAQDTYKMRTASVVRLQPVVKPTFGRLFLKQYTSFVPIEDIWHPWGSFMSGKSYNGSGAHYIPLSVPNVPLCFLAFVNMLMSTFTINKISSGWNTTSFSDSGTNPVSDIDLTDHQLIKNISCVSLSEYFNLPVDLVESMFYSQYVVDGGFSPNLDATFIPDSEDGLNNRFRLITVENIGKFDWFLPVTFDGQAYLVAGRFTNRGKNFNKILIGLGYQFLFTNDAKSVIPLFAYYKIYFDLFQPQRFTSWKDTNAFGIMEYIEQNNSSILEILTDLDSSDSKFTAVINFFFHDLPEAYYTQDVDFAAAHISGTGVAQSATSFQYLHSNQYGGAQTESQVIAGAVGGQPVLNVSESNPVSQSGLDVLKAMYQRVNIATAVGGKIKEFMQAIFGSDYRQEEESNFIGANTVEVSITDVMSTAETSEGFLGEYAGKGIGFDKDGKSFDYTCRCQGYVISMFALVPDARLAQAVDPNLSHIGKMDFFNSSFDAITLLPTRKNAIFGQSDIIHSSLRDLASGFGNIPNYTEYKVSFDKINGELALRSTRSSMLPFSFDKYILPDTVKARSLKSGIVSIELTHINPAVITEGLKWRYIGRDAYLGNFNRIFVNSGSEGEVNQDHGLDSLSRFDDNFIVYLYTDVSVMSYALPLADSFQTDAFGDHISVQKQ